MSTEFTTLQQIMLESEVKELGQDIMALHKQFKVVFTEALNNFTYDTQDPDELSLLFDEAKRRYQAAIRGLGLANKLRDPEQRRENKARVLINMNKLRSIKSQIDKKLVAVMDKLEQEDGELQQSRPSIMQQRQANQFGDQSQSPNRMGQVRPQFR